MPDLTRADLERMRLKAKREPRDYMNDVPKLIALVKARSRPSSGLVRVHGWVLGPEVPSHKGSCPALGDMARLAEARRGGERWYVIS